MDLGSFLVPPQYFALGISDCATFVTRQMRWPPKSTNQQWAVPRQSLLDACWRLRAEAAWTLSTLGKQVSGLECKVGGLSVDMESHNFLRVSRPHCSVCLALFLLRSLMLSIGERRLHLNSGLETGILQHMDLGEGPKAWGHE